MSLVSSFIANHLIKALEAELVNHSSDIQAIFMQEVEDFASTVLTWVKGKVIDASTTNKDKTS